MTQAPSATKPSPKIATITMSDTRTPADDEGGRLLGQLLTSAGFRIGSHQILREDPHLLRDTLLHQICALDSNEAVIVTGGTGISPRDRTIEAILPMFLKTLDGFGEAFRRLSYDELGPMAILSRAAAGIVRGHVVFAIPGSLNAIRLATEKLIIPILPHAVELAFGRNPSHG